MYVDFESGPTSLVFITDDGRRVTIENGTPEADAAFAQVKSFLAGEEAKVNAEQENVAAAQAPEQPAVSDTAEPAVTPEPAPVDPTPADPAPAGETASTDGAVTPPADSTSGTEADAPASPEAQGEPQPADSATSPDTAPASDTAPVNSTNPDFHEHTVTQEDLDVNAQLVADGVKVGDIINVPKDENWAQA